MCLSDRYEGEPLHDYLTWFDTQPSATQDFCLRVWDYFAEMPQGRTLLLSRYSEEKLSWILRTFWAFLQCHSHAWHYELHYHSAAIVHRELRLAVKEEPISIRGMREAKAARRH